MPFYKCVAKVPNLAYFEEILTSIERKDKVSSSTESYNTVFNNSTIFIGGMCNETVSLGIATQKGVPDRETVKNFLKKLGCSFSSCNVREITFKEFNDMAVESNAKEYVCYTNLFKKIGIEPVYMQQQFDMTKFEPKNGIWFEEHLMKDVLSKMKLLYKARTLLFGQTLQLEINRIYSEKSSDIAKGHPVHYIIESDCADTRSTVANILLSALNSNKRLDSKRSLNVEFGDAELIERQYINYCRSILNGAMVITCLNSDNDKLDVVCNSLDKYNHEILHIFCLPKNNRKAKKQLLAQNKGISFVTLTEETATKQTARTHLRALAHVAKVKTNDSLFVGIEKERSYDARELKCIYDTWISTQLKNEVFKTYKEIDSDNKKSEKSSAYEELSEMIGLAEAKKVINSTLNFFKAEGIFSKNGLSLNRPSMHMIFTGNPGTAKTSVARLFANIMKEHNYLPNGKFHEVGRSDLIGRYIGHTAPKVKKAFRKARGGVLLIDEAYSLVDSRDGSFADEAINTIVQEMENVRDDTVVIFTGYPDKMEAFLNKNPGLRSRIKFHVPFDDYTVDELFEITELIARNNDTTLSNEVRDKIMPILRTAKEQVDFGNGRFVRNLFETAKMNQVSRLVKMDETKLRKADLITLLAEDFVLPENMKRAKERIGFV